MGVLGLVLRALLLVGWIGITGTHVARYLLPGLGLVTAADPAATINPRMDRTFRYRLDWRASPATAWAKVGTCAVGNDSEDAGVRSFTEIEVTDTRMIPGVKLIRKALGAVGRGGIRLRIDQLLDARLRLHQVEVAGSIFGTDFSASGPVDHRGLDLTWKAGKQGGTMLIPEVRPDRIAGGELAMGLPAGLQPGARFSVSISSIDPTRLRLATKVAVFNVVAQATGDTAGGPALLSEVEMRLDNRLVARLWCDSAGTVHRQELADQGLRLELVQINSTDGQRWPASPGGSSTNSGSR